MKKLDHLISMLEKNQVIRAWRRGLLIPMPLILIGTMVLLLLNFPVAAYQSLMLGVLGKGWRETGLLIYHGIIQIFAISTVISVSHAFSKEKKLVKSGEVSSLSIQITAVASFILFITDSGVDINIEKASSTGLLGSLVISILACNLFCFLYQCRDRIPPGNPNASFGSDLAHAAFRAILPALLTMAVFSFAKFWTAPLWLSVYYYADSVFSRIMLEAVNVILLVVIYAPWIWRHARIPSGNRIAELTRLADEIQYIQAKQPRRLLNRYDEAGSLARALAAELRDGFKTMHPPLHLEYQPKVNRKGEVIGAEALLRWKHPLYGSISPLIILSICDEVNLTHKLGMWMMNQALGDLKQWHLRGYDNLSLSVNLSPHQLQEDASLVKTVVSCVNRFRLDPQYMELELTENATIDLSDSTLSKLRQLSELGVNISIDDFGMGHSSLLYLCDLYANVVKLDISLIRTLAGDRIRQQMVQSILSLCDQLNVKVIAEGVETEEQVQLLYEMGCKYYQGFYFSKSLSFFPFLEYVGQHGMAKAKGKAMARISGREANRNELTFCD